MATDETLRDIKEALAVVGYRMEILDRDLRDGKLERGTLAERQASIRAEIAVLETKVELMNGSILDKVGDLFVKLFTAKNAGYILIAGLVVFFILIVFWPDGIVAIINAFRAPSELPGTPTTPIP